ncbi:hypothetical protein BC936DRAFT_145033 [Jimgerdemannia flammicorona]|uniref:Zn(2)-C6 fungal-type domain-containing protein n=1 Tax=Jimgerdemannia flammicorona TaxID=994334 RepID=A0A433DLV6_9FUNG|nr:hypothetical protein BC936DRAFT_145033 [Jimgerdemannia flammicorona]
MSDNLVSMHVRGAHGHDLSCANIIQNPVLLDQQLPTITPTSIPDNLTCMFENYIRTDSEVQVDMTDAPDEIVEPGLLQASETSHESNSNIPMDLVAADSIPTLPNDTELQMYQVPPAMSTATNIFLPSNEIYSPLPTSPPHLHMLLGNLPAVSNLLLQQLYPQTVATSEPNSLVLPSATQQLFSQMIFPPESTSFNLPLSSPVQLHPQTPLPPGPIASSLLPSTLPPCPQELPGMHMFMEGMSSPSASCHQFETTSSLPYTTVYTNTSGMCSSLLPVSGIPTPMKYFETQHHEQGSLKDFDGSPKRPRPFEDGLQIVHQTGQEIYYEPRSKKARACSSRTRLSTTKKAPSCRSCHKSKKRCDRRSPCGECERKKTKCRYPDFDYQARPPHIAVKDLNPESASRPNFLAEKDETGFLHSLFGWMSKSGNGSNNGNDGNESKNDGDDCDDKNDEDEDGSNQNRKPDNSNHERESGRSNSDGNGGSGSSSGDNTSRRSSCASRRPCNILSKTLPHAQPKIRLDFRVCVY